MNGFPVLTGTPMKVSKSNQQPSTPTLGGLVQPSATGALYNVKLASDQKFLLFTPHESTASLPSTPTTPPQSTNGLSGTLDTKFLYNIFLRTILKSVDFPFDQFPISINVDKKL